MSEQDKNAVDEDVMARREAGEHWHPKGLVPEVYEAVKKRNELLRQRQRHINEEGLPNQEFTDQLSLADQELKEAKIIYNVGTPPTLPPEGE